MQINETTFNIPGFLGDYHAVIRSVEVAPNEKGELVKADGARWSTIADLTKLDGKYGPFLMNTMEEADREVYDTYYISATNPANRGARKPVATLRRKLAGGVESEHVCGLFIRKYAESGAIALIGTDVESRVRYGIFLNEAKDDGQKLAVNQ